MSTRSPREGNLDHGPEALYRATLDAAVDGILTIDSRGRISSANSAVGALFGYEEDDLLDRNVKILMPSPYRDEHDTYIHNYLVTGKKQIIGIGRRVTGLRRDGTTFPVHLSVGEALVGGEQHFVGVLHDMTAQVRADDLSRILDESLDEIYVFDSSTLKFLLVNRGGRQNLGYSMEELSKLTPLDIAPEFSPTEFAELLESLRNGTEERLVFDTVHERSDQTRYMVEHHVQVATFGGATVFVAIVLDTTDRKEAEERASRLEELASIATLIAGVAHDVGTPMSVILGYTGLLQRSVTDEKPLAQLGIIADQVRRVTKLIGTLLNLARPHTSVREEVDLATILDDAIAFFREKLKRHEIRVERDFAKAPPILGDREKLQQVFMNLLMNATQAMPEGGVFSVSIKQVGDQVEVRIADDGTGIDTETLEQIFHPFFTTKEPGEGTGLGLVVTRSIILDHQGKISVSSEFGVGTEFQIRFPVAASEA